MDADEPGRHQDEQQAGIHPRARHSAASSAFRQRRASPTTVERYGPISGIPMSGGSRLRVVTNTPRAAAVSGGKYRENRTTSARSRVPTPATVSGSWPAISATADRLAQTAKDTDASSATVNSQIWMRCVSQSPSENGSTQRR